MEPHGSYAHWVKPIKDFAFPLDNFNKWIFNTIVNALSLIHEVNLIDFINNPIIVITFKENTLNLTVSF